MVLDLPETATRRQIRDHYKRLLKRWHPDKCPANPERAEKKTREIIRAYETLAHYCDRYRYAFTEAEVEKYITDNEWWIKQFGEDPIWAKPEK